MKDEKQLIAVFRRSRTSVDDRDEIRVYSFPEWPYCFAERPVRYPGLMDSIESSPKLEFTWLAGMLSFCGYVRQDAP